MRPPLSVVAGISLALGLAAVVLASRVAGDQGPRLEVGRVKLTHLSDALRERLAGLRDDAFLTFYVSPETAMPAHMRRLEREVTALLQSMKDAGKGRVNYHVVDPTRDEDSRRFAARRKVVPVRVRSVAQDSYSEQEVFSTLTIAYGPRPAAQISGLEPEHLGRLQTLIIEHLNQLEHPRQPVFALAAPTQGYTRLREFLAGRGRVVDCSLEMNPRLPDDADVLVWVEPRTVSDDVLRSLKHFLRSGKSVIVSGGLYRPKVDAERGRLLLAPSGFDAGALLGAFGARPVPGLLLDTKLQQGALPTGEEPAPFRIMCLALNQDFRSMAREPRGTLYFVAPTPIELDADRMAEEGYTAEVVATSSDLSWLIDEVGSDGVPLATAMQGAGRPVPKQPLVTWLRPIDSWQGSLVYIGSGATFHDDTFGIDTLAQKRLAETLLDTLASDARLVTARAGTDRPAPLPALAGGDRMAWRLLVVFLFPAVLVAIGVWRWMRRPRPMRATGAPRRWVGGVALRIAAGMVLLPVLALLARGSGRADLTAQALNELAPFSREVADRAQGEHAVEAELIASGDERLPPEMRTEVTRLLGMLEEYRRAGADLHVVRTWPEDLDDAGRQALAQRGIQPVKVTSRNDEVTVVRQVWCHLVLKSGGREELLPFTGEGAFESLEFRLSFALWRLQTGEQPHLAFASDVPRLTAAEAHEEFQLKGLIPPSGKDVYSLARSVLESCGFRVTHVNARDPAMPADVDALVWLQPRRAVDPMLNAMVEYLYRGGRVLLAAQHFVMQSRQYPGTGVEFKFNYWPAPQSPDVELYYFPELGVDMVREVLFDRASLMADIETSLFRSARREFVQMRHAKPFLIRALASNYADSPFTRGVGDLPFLYGSYFKLDEDRLRQHGLRATPLMTTSPQAWSFLWKGGWLPEGYLPDPGQPLLAEEARAAGLPVAEVNEAGDPLVPQKSGALDWRRPTKLLGRVPLAVLVEGQFPWPTHQFVATAKRYGADGELLEEDPRPEYSTPEPSAEAAPGRLLMIGNSEMFKDERLTELRPEFRADHLLLNAAAALTLPDPLADVVTRRAVKKGFEKVDPGHRLLWRAVVLGTLPAAMVLLFLLRSLALTPSLRRWPACPD